MIYDLVTDLKRRITKETGYKCTILTSVPSFYELNTAYIVFPVDFSVEYNISSDAMADFSISILFVTHECEADRIDVLIKNIEKGVKGVYRIVNKCVDGLKSDYHDEDIDAVCYAYTLDSKQWMTANKILIGSTLELSYRAQVKVRY